MTKHIVFAISSVLVVLQLGIFVYRQETAEWKTYQRTYYEKLAEAVDDPAIAATPLHVEQVWDKNLNRADRCITCHGGIANPAF